MWYLLDNHNEAVATNDSLLTPSVKTITVGDTVVAYLNDSANVVSCLRGYYYTEIGYEQFPVFFSSSRIVIPEWRTKKDYLGQENYIPVFNVNGKIILIMEVLMIE